MMRLRRCAGDHDAGAQQRPVRATIALFENPIDANAGTAFGPHGNSRMVTKLRWNDRGHDRCGGQSATEPILLTDSCFVEGV